MIRLREGRRPDRPRSSRRDGASDGSLRARLAAAQDRIRTLTEENARLQHQLALALGHQRRKDQSSRPGTLER
ncbi:DnaJ-domain-containing protein 1 [Sinomonas atrocyanea]|nr:DnaJ-domain-containing protein 1 [Sinomonas atrocyanea]